MSRMTVPYSPGRERAVACHRFGKAFDGDGYTWATTDAQQTITGRSRPLFSSRDFNSPEVHKARPLWL